MVRLNRMLSNTQYLIQFAIICPDHEEDVNSNFINWAKIIYSPLGLVGTKK